MANDKKFIVKNGLRADNVEFTDSQDGSNQITLNMLNTDTLNFEGDAGSLFSITDDLTGSVFSVGDISGIPIIDVNGDTHNVTFNEFDGKVMIGGTDSGSTDSDVLNVTGNVRATAYYGDGSNLTGISASGGTDSATVSAIITADVDKTFIDALNVDADTLDGVNSTSFLRSDAEDIKTSGNLKFNDNIKLTFGTSNDAEIFHNGSDTVIDTDTGRMIYQGQGHLFRDHTGAEKHMEIFDNGSVDLYYDNSKKFETTTTGATITGELVADSATFTNMRGSLNGAIKSYNANSLRTFDITAESNGDTLQADAIRINPGLGNVAISRGGKASTFDEYTGLIGLDVFGKDTFAALFNPDGAQSLYHAGSEKMQTTATGLYVTGTVAATAFTGDGSALTGISSGGTDSATVSAIITADVDQAFVNALNVDADTLDTLNSTSFLRSDAADTKTVGDLTFNDNIKAKFGTGSDLEIYHSSSNSFIRDLGTGKLFIDTNGLSIDFRKNATETLAKFITDGAVELYYDGTKKFETTATGVSVTGTVAATAFTGDGSALTGISAGGLDSADVLTVAGTGSLTGVSGGFAVNGLLSATTKSFDIEHPTEEGKRLRYGSLEGPENGVYVRGRLRENNTIELPDHWTGLVDEDTITVNLTPIGNQQSLFVEDIRDNQVLIGGDVGVDENINCFYTVYGERKDVDQLVVEYNA